VTELADGPGQGPARAFAPAIRGLTGRLRVPGDKSVSHRAVLFGAVNEGPLEVSGFLRSADTLATIEAVRALGVEVEERGSDLVVHGNGWHGLREPTDIIDVRNSGTLIRLLPGLVASLPFLCVLTGDASIRRRPMARVLAPLQVMGATVAGRANDSLPPVAIRGGRLRGTRHQMAVASAQVKSCILLAGLRADGETTVVEPAPSRDHTERMIRHAGGRVEREGPPAGPGVVRVWPVERLSMGSVEVPGDFSSAAFFIVAALLVEDSAVTIENAGLNPTRTGLLAILERMGADVEVEAGAPQAGVPRVGVASAEATEAVEPAGRITARTSRLVATDVTAEEVPNVIDELPLFLLAAARARGVSRLRGAAELRAKESDRLRAMAGLLTGLGVQVVEHPDGMDVVGRPDGWAGGSILTQGDHRVAMAGAIAGVASTTGTTIDDADCIAVSYPGFVRDLEALEGR
jgi:3-phosphoshikimate 1-carboxyvinyltransferase